MSTVILREVQLEGFGLYARPTRFGFGPGLNVLRADNESGKSTLLAGLQSVLFGLPTRSEPDQWGTARFRCWQGAPRFQGEATLTAGPRWHRLRRDFATHEVQWATAEMGDDADTPPHDSAWQPLFAGQHNPGGRGEPTARYEEQLRRLIGVHDPGLFRLTYCLTQDPEERPPEEAAFRSRQIPESVQGLLSGSGGHIDRVLTGLFERHAAITLATTEAGLVRPGAGRSANRRTPGRLEEIRERLRHIEAERAAAGQTLEDLQGSQEHLEEIRAQLRRHREDLDHDRRLKQALEEWTRARKERNTAHRRAAELDRALRELEGLDRAIRADEERIAKEYAEYRAPGFAFDAKQAELRDLVAAEHDRTAGRRELEEAARRREAMEQTVAAGDDEIASRYAPFQARPHLLHDFDAWQEAALEYDHLRAEILELDGEVAEQARLVALRESWASLDPETRPPRPAAVLRALRGKVPRLLAQVDERASLMEEREQLARELEGPLRGAASTEPAVRAEAEAFTDRQALYRVESENAVRQLRDLDQRLAERERAEQALSESHAALVIRLGEPDRSPSSGPWAAAADRLQQKLDALQVEAALLRRVDAAERTLRVGLFRVVGVPALAAAAAGGAAGLAAGTALGLKAPLPWILAAAIAVAGGMAVGALGYRRGKGVTRRDCNRAREELAQVRRSLVAIDATLGPLARLDPTAIQELKTNIFHHAQLAADAARLRALAPSEEEQQSARQAAEQASHDLAAFERRMAPFGPDPAGLVADWRRGAARSGELEDRIARATQEIGPIDPSATLPELLPEEWREPVRLAHLVRARAAGAAGANAAAPGTTWHETLATLRGIGEEDWRVWIDEAAAFEETSQRLASLQLRRQALLGGANDESERLRLLEARVDQLALACAPLTLEVPREEVAALAEAFERVRTERDRCRTLLEDLGPEIARMEERVRTAEQRAVALRDGLRGLLRPAGSDPAVAIQRMQEARELLAELQRALRTREQLVQPLGIAELTELAARLEGAREESGQAFERARTLEERYILLKELADADPERLQQQQTDLDRRIQQTEADLEQLAGRQESLRARAAEAHAEGRRVGNVAALELELEALQREESRLVVESEAIAVAFLTVREAESLFSRTHRERLEARATEVFARLSRDDRRSVRLGDRFEIQIVVHGGRPCAVRQLSQGTRDQLALALRLAVADLLAEERRVPLFFDDPFLSFDPRRLDALRDTLTTLAAERQVVVLSHRPELAAWGHPIEVQAQAAP